MIEDNAFDVRYIEIYDTENSPVLGREGFSSKNHLLTVRSEETDEVKYAVPVYTGEKIDSFSQRSDKIIMTLFDDGARSYDFELYDLVFRKVYDGGNVAGKFMAAHYRLEYPTDLSDKARKMYVAYIDEHAEDIIIMLIKKEDADTKEITEFPYLDKIESQCFDKLIALAEELKKTDIAELLKKCKENNPAEAVHTDQKTTAPKLWAFSTEEKEERLKQKLFMQAFEENMRKAKNGDSDAQYKLARAYHEGKAVERDDKLAAEWMSRSAERENVYAQTMLGMYYEDGTGVEKNYEKAFELFEKAAEQGNMFAQYKAGMCYALGNGVQEDMKKATEMFERSAEQGLSGAQFNTALCYECGEGVEQDFEKAFEWYTKAAEQENRNAYNRLGRLYENGNGVEADINKSVEMYKKSAEMGSIGGMKDLARCYEEGIGVEKDLQKAKELKEKAGVS